MVLWSCELKDFGWWAVFFPPQTVNGGTGELHGESSQSPVCHLLEK